MVGNVNFIIASLLEAGFEAYAVGGCVRDYLLNKIPNDYDVTTNATPDEIIDVFSSFRLNLRGLKHGTVGVIRNGEMIEITTFRIDGEYSDSRHPESVTFTSSLKQDLARRDFTVNAMALDSNGNIIDYFDGRKDLKDKIIRSVGNPEERFSEDALRIMRGLRFASNKGFSLEENTLLWCNRLAENLKNVAYERIFAELKKMVFLENCPEIMRKTLPVFSAIFPTLKASKREWKWICDCARLAEGDGDLVLAFILFSADTEQELLRLRADNKLKKKILLLKQMLSIPFKRDREFLQALMNEFSKEAVLFFVKYLVCTKKETVEAYALTYEIAETCILLKDLQLNGELIRRAGFKGKKIHFAKEFLLKAVNSGDCENVSEALLDYLEENRNSIL